MTRVIWVQGLCSSSPLGIQLWLRCPGSPQAPTLSPVLIGGLQDSDYCPYFTAEETEARGICLSTTRVHCGQTWNKGLPTSGLALPTSRHTFSQGLVAFPQLCLPPSTHSGHPGRLGRPSRRQLGGHLAAPGRAQRALQIQDNSGQGEEGSFQRQGPGSGAGW